MESQVNIVILVDVIGALSDGTLHNGNLMMMDDGTGGSTGQGTAELCTMCRPWQTIQWTVHAVDVQTPADIKSITFLGSGCGGSGGWGGCGGCGGCSGDTWGRDDSLTGNSAELLRNVWCGLIPPYLVPGVEYRYRLEIQMYEGTASAMHIDSCSLKSV